jgi:hypothetical protein
MKAIVIGAALATLAIGFARAESPAPSPQEHRPVCLWTYLIDHTKTVDPKTILFTMKNGDVWKNTLAQACNGLMFNGFEYVTHDGSICDNMQSIMVLRTHEVCLLGAFTRVPAEEPKPKAQ